MPSLFQTFGGSGQRWLNLAAKIGALWVASHLVTILVTVMNDGANWGVTAWLLDLAGLVAGFCFTILCWFCSRLERTGATKSAIWICVWASITLCVRLLDTLMLLGLIKIETVYPEPHGPAFWSNVVSEILIGNIFALAALVGSVKILGKSN